MVEGPEYLVPRRRGEPVVVAEADPAWPHQYAEHEHRIRAALAHLVIDVHHVGSTSVARLAAKPVIDICLVVPDATDEDAYVPHLQEAGYVFAVREPTWYQHRFFRGDDARVNLHVFPAGCEETVRMLAFRDWLRSHPEDRALYEATKRRLAAGEWEFVQDYAEAKSEVVHEILARAR
jgi:GrpB-like predicted nucleotidyltransferase (UPF0157 family)